MSNYPKDALSGKQQLFAEGILKGLSYKDAALQAGYGEQYVSKNSAQMMKCRKLVQYIRLRIQQKANAISADADFALSRLKENANNPQATIREQNDALKILLEHLSFLKELDVKMKSLEVTKETSQSPNQPIVINVMPVEKP
jgi:hypothetical protein